MYRLIITILVIFSSSTAMANTGVKEPMQLVWPFEGMFGTFDRQAAQRGAQVYFEVCAVCHGNQHLYYRNLKNIGFSVGEIKAIAAKYTVKDGPNAEGEMFERPALPADKFVTPYANEEAGRAAHNGALPVDLSLITKSRHDGPNYVYSLITGYSEPPAGFKLQDGLSYNPYFEGNQIGMPPPLTDGQVTYMDGTNASVDQMARDVVVFLQWAAEPEMEHRKSMGLKVMLFLVFFTVFFYFTKKKVWKSVK